MSRSSLTWLAVGTWIVLITAGCRETEKQAEQAFQNRAGSPPGQTQQTVAPAAGQPQAVTATAPASSSASASATGSGPTLQTPSLSALEAELTRIAAQVLPAVVSVRVERTVTPPTFDLPRGFFGPFMDPDQSEAPQRMPVPGLGSGMIFRADGYILTNSHVVREADRIEIVLNGHSTPLQAKLVGEDQRTDLAVVKLVTPPAQLPSVVFGDSDSVKVGSFALAIGSPFEFDSSVTLGVVSAKERALPDPRMRGIQQRDLIQTDASINPGNSGGPLINIRGEVIGVNTAIYSPSGGNVGIGFAVPINTAKHIVPELMERGFVVRGYLGVELEDRSPEELEALYQIKEGAVVAGVTPDGPAAAAGMQAGDVVVEFAGQKVTGVDQLVDLVTGSAPGSRVEVKILRNGKPRVLKVTVGDLPAELGGRSQTGTSKSATDEVGLAVEPMTEALAQRTGLPAKGVFIRAVQPGSAAARAGIEGGVITKMVVQGQTFTINTLPDYQSRLRQAVKAGVFGLFVVAVQDDLPIERFYTVVMR